MIGRTYWRAGEPERARQQLALLASVSGRDAWVSALSRKFDPPAPQDEPAAPARREAKAPTIDPDESS
jgi:hypothetical protein